VTLGRALVELSPLLPAAMGAAASTALLVLVLVLVLVGMPAHRHPVPARLGCPFPVARRQHDLELVQLVPLLVGALTFRDGKKRLEAGAGRILLCRIVHPRIIPQLAKKLSP
jgi:hypothetical protein